jgi:ribose 1,5-bisphosphokinase PhnN
MKEAATAFEIKADDRQDWMPSMHSGMNVVSNYGRRY